MINILRRGQTWLSSQMEDHVSETVEYWRGTLSVSLAATVGRSMLRLAADDTIFWTDRDYIFSSRDLVLNGETELPLVGDRIHHTREEDGVTEIYEVLSPGGEPHYRFSDAWHQRLRVHCKRIGVET